MGEGRWEREGGGEAREGGREEEHGHLNPIAAAGRTEGGGRTEAQADSAPLQPSGRLVASPSGPPGRARTGDVRSRRGLSGQFCWGFVAAFPETGASGEPGRPSQVGANPLRAPRSGPSRSARCPPSSSRPHPLLRTFPHFLASPSPSLANIALPVARPGDRPARLPCPARDSPTRGENKQPRGHFNERAEARRHTREDERGGRPPRGPRRIMGARQIAGGT